MVMTVGGCVAGARDRCGRPVSVDRATRDWSAGQSPCRVLALRAMAVAQALS